MTIRKESALLAVMSAGDEWQSWRALRLAGDDPGPMPPIPYQDEIGAFFGPGGSPSPGGAGEALCHLKILGLGSSGPAVVAADWLMEMRTPAEAWLDRPDEVPGFVDDPGVARVWATASAACGLMAVGRDPGPRSVRLLRGEGELEGSFTGGAYPTFAAASLYWMVEGPKTEMAEWGLRWIRENTEEWWGEWERATALTFFGAAGIPAEHATVDQLLDELLGGLPEDGAEDLGLTLRALELSRHFEAI
ncbi:MAG: hypothetical protein GEU71_10045 [Actinobacteria bacterium]|nr:hypothetical protein [Actinomycetota bacterium]